MLRSWRPDYGASVTIPRNAGRSGCDGSAEYEVGLPAERRFLDVEEALYRVYIEDRHEELAAENGGPDARA